MTQASPDNTGNAQRRTFAIISHPDAGKTTLTEKLLLSGGAIHTAGEVKARGAQRHAHSDWMELERKRGISVTSSVMTFEHRGVIFNLLDTPGHQDFSEDTYRTLTAVDSAIMVLDAAKGIESQTQKLFEVCRLRDIPIITFINKMDREAQDPFSLLDEIEKKLALDVCPVNWPVGMGDDLRGCYDLLENKFYPFSSQSAKELKESVQVTGVNDKNLLNFMTVEHHQKLIDDISLLEVAGKKFDLAGYREGHLSPVYFGGALRNFGVSSLLQGLYDFAPTPRTQKANTRQITPDENKVTGFVFKIQANMDPNHRDRIAFVRICSGTFKRGMKLKQTRTGKFLAVQSPVFFLARERSLAEEGRPGDIIGIPNHGKLAIGDTLTEGEDFYFSGIPSFAPEILRHIRIKDPLKIKNMRKALEDLSQEGVLQLFKPLSGSDWILGVVGQLQLEVLISRLQGEYQVDASFEMASYDTARWLSSDNATDLQNFIKRYRNQIAEDINGSPVYLVRTQWDLKSTQENNKSIRFSTTREQFV
jgi:peptide chain release factor 3